MKTFGNRLLLVRFVCFCVMLAALYLCLGAPLYAQTQGSCPGDANISQRGSGADVQCRVSNLLGRSKTLIDDVKTRASNCTGPHCNSLNNMITRAQNAHQRGINANNRMTPDDYANLNTIRKVKCSGKNSDCAQGNGSYSGGTTDTVDPNIGSDMADQLDDATGALDDAHNEMQASQTASVTAAAAAAPAGAPPTFQPLYDFTADAGFEGGLLNALDAHPLADQNVKLIVLGANRAAEIAEKIADHFCKQDAELGGVGGNTSVLCVPWAAIVGATKQALELVEFAGDLETDWEVHGAYMREDNLNTNLGQVDTDVLSVQAAAGNAQASITQLQAQVTALQVSINALQAQLANTTSLLSQKSNVTNDMNKQIMQLLLSPDGSRSLPASLLTCTGDNSTSSPCPPVPINCSASTGLCSFSPH